MLITPEMYLKYKVECNVQGYVRELDIQFNRPNTPESSGFRISAPPARGGQSAQLTNSCDNRAGHVSWPCTCLKTRNASQIPKCVHNVAPRLMQWLSVK